MRGESQQALVEVEQPLDISVPLCTGNCPRKARGRVSLRFLLIQSGLLLYLSVLAPPPSQTQVVPLSLNISLLPGVRPRAPAPALLAVRAWSVYAQLILG